MCRDPVVTSLDIDGHHRAQIPGPGGAMLRDCPKMLGLMRRAVAGRISDIKVRPRFIVGISTDKISTKTSVR